MPALKTRQPTGAVPWPVILLEGEEKAGKSWAAAEFSASDRVGRTLWLDLSEGAADEYGEIEGARYEVLVHDGTWHDILDRVQAARDEARRAHEAGERPVVLVIDSMSAEWAALSDWAAERARLSPSGQKQLKDDPNAELAISPNFWNDANKRHRQLMALLLTFPGIVVLTARGKEVASIDAKGKPIPNTKEYRVEGQKGLGYDVSVWVRMFRNRNPMIIGARSVHAGVRPGSDRPREIENFSLEWLVFDALRCDPRRAHVRDLQDISVDATVDWEAEIAAAGTDLDALRGIWERAKGIDPANTALADRIKAAVAAAKAAPAADEGAVGDVADQSSAGPMMASADQLTRLHIALGKCGIADPTDKRVTVGQMVGRQLASSKELTFVEAGDITATLNRLIAGDTDPAKALVEHLDRLAEPVEPPPADGQMPL